MAMYRYFEDQKQQRVKSGFCWPAFFFTVFYFAVKRMWRWFSLWCVVWVVSAFIYALRYSASMQEYYTILNPLVLFTNCVFHLVPGFFANRWHVSSLVREGYVEINPENAVSGLPISSGVQGQAVKGQTNPSSDHVAVLVVAAVLVATMVLFPPYIVKRDGNVIDTGYGVIFDLPNFMDMDFYPAQVNVATLGAQIVGVLVVARLLFLVKRRN